MEVVLVLLLNVFFFLFERFNIMFENIGDSLNVLINYWINICFLLCFENMIYLKKYRINNYFFCFIFIRLF